MMKQENIRNFSIIAHIDMVNQPGRSFVRENRLISEQISSQVLDSLVWKERGITIKLNAVRLIPMMMVKSICLI